MPGYFKERCCSRKPNRWGNDGRGKGGVDGVGDDWDKRSATGFDKGGGDPLDRRSAVGMEKIKRWRVPGYVF